MFSMRSKTELAGPCLLLAAPDYSWLILFVAGWTILTKASQRIVYDLNDLVDYSIFFYVFKI